MGNLKDEVANVQVCVILVSVFKLDTCNCVHFWTKTRYKDIMLFSHQLWIKPQSLYAFKYGN